MQDDKNLQENVVLQEDKNLQENVALREENTAENVAESLPETYEEKSEGKLEESSDVLGEALEKIDDSSEKKLEDNPRESEISRESEIEGQKNETGNERADLLKKKASATAQSEKQ